LGSRPPAPCPGHTIRIPRWTPCKPRRFDRGDTGVSRRLAELTRCSLPREIFDPYAVLGLPSTATPDEITHAYRRQVKAHHPDTRTTRHTIPPTDEQLRRVLAAYALLRDPERRARYDRAATRYDRAANRRPTARRAPAETTNTLNTAGALRILGLTVGVRVRRLSE
jgi:DnaJ domain